MKRVYVAGAYSANNVIDVLGNMRRGLELSVKVLKAGYAPFSPWLDFQFGLLQRVSLEEYYAYSMAWLEASDAVLVVMKNLPTSMGTQAEIKRAKELGIPVRYGESGLAALKEILQVDAPPAEATSNRVIGFTGYATSGKDAAADCLVDIGWTKIGFADPMYEQALAIDPIIFLGESSVVAYELPLYTRMTNLVEKVGWTQAKTVPEVRRFLQRAGTEGGRDILGQNIWVDIAEKKLLKCGTNTCFTNVRFQNECDMIRRHNGTIVRIVRPGTGPESSHSSEDQAFEADFTVYNDGTLEDLKQRVLKLVTML